jgi:long-subunit acyl-CoA synthetase (AMP-forming)
VTLYETYGAEAIRFILNQTQLDTVITLGSKVQLLLDLQAGKHTLKTIVSM